MSQGHPDRSRLRSLGEAIRSRRETLGISQRSLATELSTSQNAVYEWETGSSAPRADTLWRIADALDFTPSELFAVAETIEHDSTHN